MSDVIFAPARNAQETRPGEVTNFSIGEGIAGWVDKAANEKVRVQIFLNDSLICETSAGRPTGRDDAGRTAGFLFNVRHLADYLGTGDRIQVRCRGSALELPGARRTYVCSNTSPSRAAELIEKVASGYIFTKNGAFQLSKRVDEKWKSDIIGFHKQLRRFFKRRFGYDLFPFFGTLLGAVREGDIIANDDDFDLAYISKHNTPEKIEAEFVQIASKLMQRGYKLKVGQTRATMKVRKQKGLRVDIYYCWFDRDGKFQVSFGYNGPEALKSPGFANLVAKKIGQSEVLVPECSEAILAQLYGESWRIPDQGFSHGKRKIDKRYLISQVSVEQIHWRNFYRHHTFTEPSPFARFVLEHVSKAPPDLVVEFGCGMGRDALFFGKSGLKAVAADLATDGLAQARKISGELGIRNCQFVRANVAVADDIRSVFAIKDVQATIKSGGALMVYCRFFLHSITLGTERLLFATLRELMPVGSLLAAEFRTDEDQYLPKVFGTDHYRRYINCAEFMKRMREVYGFEVAFEKQGTGLSPYKKEDPHLCRVVATKTAGSTARAEARLLLTSL
jgi:hypothetical protein